MKAMYAIGSYGEDFFVIDPHEVKNSTNNNQSESFR